MLLLHRWRSSIQSGAGPSNLDVLPHHGVDVGVGELVDEVLLGQRPECRDARLVGCFEAHDRVDLVGAGMDAVAHQTGEQPGTT